MVHGLYQRVSLCSVVIPSSRLSVVRNWRYLEQLSYKYLQEIEYTAGPLLGADFLSKNKMVLDLNKRSCMESGVAKLDELSKGNIIPIHLNQIPRLQHQPSKGFLADPVTSDLCKSFVIPSNFFTHAETALKKQSMTGRTTAAFITVNVRALRSGKVGAIDYRSSEVIGDRLKIGLISSDWSILKRSQKRSSVARAMRSSNARAFA